MVACANDRHSRPVQSDSCHRFIIGLSSLHLFLVLTMSISKEQQSVLAIIAGLLFIALLTHNYGFAIAAGVAVITLPFSILNAPIHKAWTFLANVLGWITRHVILFILFYLFLTPFSFFLRLLGKQTIDVRWEKAKPLFIERNHVYDSADFTNPW